MYYSAKFKLCAENAANHSLIGPGTWAWGGEKLGGMEWKHGGILHRLEGRWTPLVKIVARYSAESDFLTQSSMCPESPDDVTLTSPLPLKWGY